MEGNRAAVNVRLSTLRIAVHPFLACQSLANPDCLLEHFAKKRSRKTTVFLDGLWFTDSALWAA